MALLLAQVHVIAEEKAPHQKGHAPKTPAAELPSDSPLPEPDNRLRKHIAGRSFDDERLAEEELASMRAAEKETNRRRQMNQYRESENGITCTSSSLRYRVDGCWHGGFARNAGGVAAQRRAAAVCPQSGESLLVRGVRSWVGRTARSTQPREPGHADGDQHRIAQGAGQADREHMLALQPLPQDKGILCPDGKDQRQTEGKSGKGGGCPICTPSSCASRVPWPPPGS